MVNRMVTLILMMVLALPAYALIIKIGSPAPERSPWDKALEELGREWSSITNGLVKLKIYPGGIAGNEEDTIRKTRMGILGGAVITNRGFINLDPDIYALNVPFLITTEGELNYVLDKMNPTFEKTIEKKGFKVVIMFMAGWVHFFTKKPVNYPDDSLEKWRAASDKGMDQLIGKAFSKEIYDRIIHLLEEYRKKNADN